jgi:hypothetical protein
MDIGIGVTMPTGEALAVAFEPQSLIVMGDASGFSDEPYGAVRAGHPIIRCQWPLPLTKEIHASRGAAADLNHTRTCGFACGSGPRCVLA